MNPKNFDSLIDSVLTERRLPSGGKSKKERYADPKTREMLKKSVAKHDAKKDASGQTQVQKREKTRQKRRKGILPKPGSATCSKPGCLSKATEADHTSRSGEKTQNLCKAHHQKVTDQRREQKGLALNSISRAVDNILSEADPGEMSRDFPSAWKYRGEKELYGRKGRAKAKFVKPAYPKKYDKVKYNFTLYQHPTHPQVLIVPKDKIKNDFIVVTEAMRPTVYHIITTADGESYVGKIVSGQLIGSRGSERLIRLYDVNRNEIVTIPKFIGQSLEPTREFIKATERTRAGESNIKAESIEEDDALDRYWPIHRKMVLKALQEQGKSEFKEALAPREKEDLDSYRSRISKVTPREDLFTYYHALEQNRETGKYRWLRDAGSEENIPKIAALVPKNMGGSSIDVMGNVSDVSVPDWLMDPKTGGSAIEPAEGIGPGGVLKPSTKRSDRKRAKRAKRRKKSYISRDDVKRMRSALEDPFSEQALETIFLSMQEPRKNQIKEIARAGVIRDIAIDNYGKGLSSWNKKDPNKQKNYLDEAEVEYKKNIENYKEQYKKAILHMVYIGKIRQIGIIEAEKLKICPICDGKKTIQTVVGGKTYTDKCRTCNATGISPFTRTRGYQPKRTAEEIEDLAKSTYDIMQKYFRAECPVCADIPSEVSCPYCSGTGFDDTKLQTIRKEWGEILRNSLGDDYFDDQDSLLFAQKLFKSIADYERSYERTEDDLGNNYALVYTQNRVAENLRSHKIIGGMAKSMPLKWGFISRSEAGEVPLGVKLRQHGLPVPYESKSRRGPRRTIPVEKLYNERQTAELGGKKKPQYFIELRKFPTGKKHFENEIRKLAGTDPRLRKKFSEFMQGANRVTAMKEIFRNNKALVHNATRTFEPKPNNVVGIGFITSIERGRQAAYEHPGEQAAIDLAELRGEDYEKLNHDKQQERQQEAYAIRLAAQSQGINPLKNDMKRLLEVWEEMEKQERVVYLLRASAGGSELIGGSEHSSIPHRQYAVNYIDIETGGEGKLILGPNDTVNIVKPLAGLLKDGEKLAMKERRAGKAPEFGKRSKKIADWKGPERPTEMEDIVKTILPARLMRKNYSPDDIARFID